MKSAIGNRTASRWRPGGIAACACLLFWLIAFGAGVAARAQHHQERRQAAPARQARPEPKPSAGRPVQNVPNGRAAGNYGRTGAFAQPPAANYPAIPGESFMGSRRVPGLYPGSGRPGQEHLPQWLNQHQNLSPSQQEQALRHEPGFNRLAPNQQQRVMDRLRSLDSRPPQIRERMLARNEAFERLSPEGRQEVRAAAQSLRMMPEDRRRMVGRAFNDLRAIPPSQRTAVLNSARFEHNFSPQERHILSNLLSIEPYQQR